MNFKKRTLSLFLAASLVLTINYAPTPLTPRAHALFGVLDTVINLPDIVWKVLDAIAYSIAETMVNDMVYETIRWANSGFEGGPAFAINPQAYFTRLADEGLGKYLETEVPFVCGPFRDTISMSLNQYYYQPPSNYTRCTFTQAFGNLEDFYQSFDNGGWSAYIKMTQDPTNNPFGAYLSGSMALNLQLKENTLQKEKELDRSGGFFNYRPCVERNPPKEDLDKIREWRDSSDPLKRSWANNYPRDKYDLSKQPDQCIKEGDITTPGTAIKDALEQTSLSGLNRMMNVQSLDQLIGAFATGLLRRYVFADDRGRSGLFVTSQTNLGREVIDVDGDGIPDGYDYDGDGELDICHHGLKDPEDLNMKPSNSNCILSKNAPNSSFFIPICDRLAGSIKEGNKYLDFITRNTFSKPYSRTWLNRTLAMEESVSSLVNTMARYEIEKYDPVIFRLDQYTKYLGEIIESLTKDQDLQTGKNPGGTRDEIERQKIISNTRGVLGFLENFQRVMGACNNPDVEAITNVPLPTVEEAEKEEDPENPGTPGAQVSGSCFATVDNARVGASVLWISQTNLNNPSYSWSGDEITSGSSPALSVSYTTTGTKRASVTITGTDSNNQERTLSPNCTTSVNVTQMEAM